MSNLSMANDRLAEVKGVCKESDVVVVCLGLDADLEGEEGDTGNQFASGDKPDLNLPGLQQEILETAYNSGKPVILVLLSGSALAVSWAQEHVAAVIQAWYPGAQGGKAIAETIFGESSPEGKLPVTFYRTTEELPEFTDYSMKNRTYRYMEQEALYPFGYGLSYTNFLIDNITFDTFEITEKGINISVSITNTGLITGGEVVQIYVKSEEIDTPNPSLKAFKKVHLKAQEKAELELTLKAEDFGLFEEDGIKRLNKGKFIVYVGTSQPDSRSYALTGIKSQAFQLKSYKDMTF